MIRLLEMQDKTCGDARLMLRAGIEAGEQVIDLDRAQRDARNKFDVEAATDSGSEGTVGDDTTIEGFMRAAGEGVNEGRDGTRK